MVCSRDERGFSLVELLVAGLLLALVLLALLPFTLLALRSEGRTSSRSQAIVNQRNAVANLARELRSARSVLLLSPYAIQVAPSDTSSPIFRVRCAQILDPRPGHPNERQCMRYDVIGGAEVNSRVLLQGVTNSQTATPAFQVADGRYVTIKLIIHPDKNNGRITLENGIALRNWTG